VRRYLRIPYDVLDCWQLCGHVLQLEAGVELPSFADDYERSADETLWSERIREQVAAVAERERLVWPRVEGEPRRFDLALYHLGGTRWHVALVAGGGWALNTDLRRGSHPMRLRHSEWARRLDGYFRAPALAH
jgi:cell wall-associated NlpC family hydrolase